MKVFYIWRVCTAVVLSMFIHKIYTVENTATDSLLLQPHQISSSQAKAKTNLASAFSVHIGQEKQKDIFRKKIRTKSRNKNQRKRRYYTKKRLLAKKSSQLKNRHKKYKREKRVSESEANNSQLNNAQLIDTKESILSEKTIITSDQSKLSTNSDINCEKEKQSSGQDSYEKEQDVYKQNADSKESVKEQGSEQDTSFNDNDHNQKEDSLQEKVLSLQSYCYDKTHGPIIPYSRVKKAHNTVQYVKTVAHNPIDVALKSKHNTISQPAQLVKRVTTKMPLFVKTLSKAVWSFGIDIVLPMQLQTLLKSTNYSLLSHLVSWDVFNKSYWFAKLFEKGLDKIFEFDKNSEHVSKKIIMQRVYNYLCRLKGITPDDYIGQVLQRDDDEAFYDSLFKPDDLALQSLDKQHQYAMTKEFAHNCFQEYQQSSDKTTKKITAGIRAVSNAYGLHQAYKSGNWGSTFFSLLGVLGNVTSIITK